MSAGSVSGSTTLVRCGDGTTLHVHEWGAPAGPPTLLLHGIRGYGRWFLELAQALAPTHRVVAPDQRGRAASSHAATGDYRIDAHVDDLEDLLDCLGIDEVTIVGHSLGGLVALAYAGRHPEQVARLVVGDVGPEIDDGGLSRIRREAEERPVDFDSWDAATAYLSETHPSGSPERALERKDAMLAEDGQGRVRWRYDPLMMTTAPEPPARVRRWMARLSCPTLVVRGARSDLLGERVAAGMLDVLPPGSRLVTLPNAGHMLMDDDVDGFTAAVVNFVGRTEP